jgi:hypothetical protein
MADGMNSPSPRWLPDPTGDHEYRYWDGTAWTDDVSDAGVTSTDPMGDDAAAPAEDAAGVDAPGPGSDPADDDLTAEAPVRAPAGKPPGRSTRLLVGLGVVFVVLLAGIAFVVLNQDDNDKTTEAQQNSDAQLIDDISVGLRESMGDRLTDKQADCLAESMVEEFGSDRLIQAGFGAANSPDPFALLEDSEVSTLFQLIISCGVTDFGGDLGGG